MLQSPVILKIKAQQTARKIRRFFAKSPDTAAMRGNQKGQGFHLFKKPPKDFKFKELKKQLIFGGVIITAGVFTMLVLIGQHSTLDFTVLVTAMVALCGLIAYDIVSRRYWEKKLTFKLEELISSHDRLVREVARNRSDIAILKEGLGEMALSVESQGRDLLPSSSTEARMIETIVNQLGALGDKPRSDLNTRYDKEILELEMMPPPSSAPPVSELEAETNPDFNKYSDVVVAELVRQAVHKDKFDIFMQPIVSLPQRKIRMYEVYTRILAGNGVYLPAQRYLDLAEREKLVPAIDNLLLLRCLQMLRDRRNDDENAPYVINISCRTLGDRGFMNDLVGFLSQDHKMASRLIFELPYKEIEALADSIAPVIEGLARLGCRFSADRVLTRKININLLKSCHIRFIKLDASWLISEGGSNQGFSRIVRMKKQLDSAGIDLVAVRIEQETSLRELLDFNIDFGQGYLFGKPDHRAAYNLKDKNAA